MASNIKGPGSAAASQRQTQMEVLRTELHEVQNADFLFAAFEKSMRMYELVQAGTPEQVHYRRLLDSKFQSLQN